jgi:CO dehydrogenase/acetyl-CoA synthase gamma subunit (corrinoid Fe-S protein)
MALKGLDIFKLTPKKNCKECGSPTCMAFAMKVAQGAVSIDKCPYMSEEALATLSSATAPLMKSITVGAGANEHKLGGETVLFRHEKTLVSKNLFAATLCSCMTAEEIDAAIAEAKKVDYERIGEREYVEFLFLNYAGNGADKYVELVKKAAEADRALILDCCDAEAAKAAKEAEDAKVQKEEDIKNIIYSFGEMLENSYPEFGFKAEELDEQTLESLAAIAIMLLDIEAMKHTSAVRVKPAKSNKTFELHKTNSDEVFKDFFKSLGL